MSLHALSSTSPGWATSALAATAQAGTAGQAASNLAVDPPPPHAHHGDGHVLQALKSALGAAGIDVQDEAAAKPTTMQDMHAFTHEVFAALHDIRTSGTPGAPRPSLSDALATLSDEASQGTAPSALQSAFTQLQGDMSAGGGASSATLASVLTAMSGNLAGEAGNTVGGALNAQA